MVICGCADHNWWGLWVVRRQYPHVSIDQVFLDIFDEVGRCLESRTIPKHTRSGFVNKAAGLWVEAVKADHPDLKALIEEIEQRHTHEAAQVKDRGRRRKGKVLQFKASSSPSRGD